MAPRMKVFVTSDGLTDFVVATSSRLKALAAWGVHQDLFKTGAARETDDPALVEAATARPGEVLRRPAGSREMLTRQKPAKAAKPKPEKKKPSPAAFKRLAELQSRLDSLEATHQRALAEIAHAREDLNSREALEARNYAMQRDRLAGDLQRARKALG